jgi:hypothetical protein
MSVPDDQIVHDHIERCGEDGLIPLRLPELDIEAVFVIANPAV